MAEGKSASLCLWTDLQSSIQSVSQQYSIMECPLTLPPRGPHSTLHCAAQQTTESKGFFCFFDHFSKTNEVLANHDKAGRQIGVTRKEGR